MIKQLLFSLTMVASATAQKAPDGYEFKGNPPALRTTFTTVIVEYESTNKLNQVAKEYGLTKRTHAFNIYNLDKNICTIHIVKPSKDYMPEHIGHELVHCIYGAWHK